MQGEALTQPWWQLEYLLLGTNSKDDAWSIQAWRSGGIQTWRRDILRPQRNKSRGAEPAVRALKLPMLASGIVRKRQVGKGSVSQALPALRTLGDEQAPVGARWLLVS